MALREAESLQEAQDACVVMEVMQAIDRERRAVKGQELVGLRYERLYETGDPGGESFVVVPGDHVTLGAGTVVKDSRVSNALVAANSHIENAVLDGAMVGANAAWHGTPDDASIGDFCTVGRPRA